MSKCKQCATCYACYVTRPVDKLAKKYANMPAVDRSFGANNAVWELWDIYLNCGIAPRKWSKMQQLLHNDLNVLCRQIDEPFNYTLQQVATASSYYCK